MAKRKIPKGQLGDWADEFPEDVQEAADAYDRDYTSKTKATGKLNTAKDVLIDVMKANSLSRVRIRNGEKWLVVSATDKVTYTKPEETGD